MGLHTWRQSPEGPIRRDDIRIAKNYLTEDELRRLNRLVSQYLDFAESMAERRRPMTMSDWKDKLDAFLQVNEHELLTHAGQISHDDAVDKALCEFEKFETSRRTFEAENPISDFDQLIDRTKRLDDPAG